MQEWNQKELSHELRKHLTIFIYFFFLTGRRFFLPSL